jgi:Mitochondrial small ribosomal subunit Rsm22
MTWEELDWAVLDRLRDLFLSGGAARGPYWTSREDLANYDFTFGERIGWKWDAVLRELDQRGWRPAPTAAPHDPSHRPLASGDGHIAVLDWGCGSGIAGRRVVDWLGPERVSVLRVWDHSGLAADFAAAAAEARFPGLRVEHVTPGFLAGDTSVGVVVISHVLNELAAAELPALRQLAARAGAILWVEPGTHECSRELIALREPLRARFRVVAPCTHQAGCGLLAPENQHHWCHHFAAPPAEIFADSHWVRFGQRAGIDLRSLPYSFLVLEGRPGGAPPAEGAARIIGVPRIYKGYAKVLSCDAGGVAELILQKRDGPALFKAFKRPKGALLYRWQRDGDRIRGGGPDAGSADGPRATLDSPGAL